MDSTLTQLPQCSGRWHGICCNRKNVWRKSLTQNLDWEILGRHSAHSAVDYWWVIDELLMSINPLWNAHWGMDPNFRCKPGLERPSWVDIQWTRLGQKYCSNMFQRAISGVNTEGTERLKDQSNPKHTKATKRHFLEVVANKLGTKHVQTGMPSG